jgi:hypothetical protein
MYTGNCVLYGFSNLFLLRWYLFRNRVHNSSCCPLTVPIGALEMLKLLTELGLLYVGKGPTNFEVNWPWKIYYPFSIYVGAGIATAYGLDDRGVEVRVMVGSRIFSTSSKPALGPTKPPIQCLPGALSPGVKQPGCEANHSHPTSAEVKKTWIYTSIPAYVFMA